MSGHTPSPWRVSRDHREPYFRVAEVEMLHIYSEQPEGGSPRCGTPEADARLIAASPWLLAALQDAITLFACHCEEPTRQAWLERARAIASTASPASVEPGGER